MVNAQFPGGPRPENPLSTQLLNTLFPQPTSGAATGNNYSFAAPNRNDSDNFLVKINHQISDRLDLSGRYIFGDGTQNFPLTTGNGSPLPQYQTVVPTRIQLFGLNLTQVLNARLINESRAGYNRFVQFFNPLDVNNPLPQGLNTGAQTGGLPTMTVTASPISWRGVLGRARRSYAVRRGATLSPITSGSSRRTIGRSHRA